ncbi:ABC transporter ATP-binding protein [Roseixanthobacter liquoris]|uniref:ABC transporter ATP-binding protein n=1 Tax=Roseixanthobacter liquoris TaxID=3119921 RepID=UPI00372A545D
MQAQLQIDDVTIRYRTRRSEVTAAYRVSFDVYRGERTVLLGPSGCGKSSLLKAVGGFIRPLSGDIRLNGRAITGPGPDRMMVFQEFDQLLPWKSVLGNVAFALRKGAGLAADAAKARALEAIEAVRLTAFRDAYPHELSGGMKQRVAIARAMAMQPELLLMDEPFAALDALTRQQMQEELIRLWREIGFSLLFVTHSIDEAILVGSRIIVLSPHPGRVRAEIDCRDITAADRGGERFEAMRRRIDALLFGDRTHA